MKTFRKIGMALFTVFTCMNLFSCSDNEEITKEKEEEYYNAKGIQIVSFIENSSIGETDILIDNDYVLALKPIEEDSYFIYNTSLYVVYDRYKSIQQIYDYISNQYIYIGEVNENTDFTTFCPNPERYIQKMKSYLGDYDYIAFYQGHTILFNRTGENLR